MTAMPRVAMLTLIVLLLGCGDDPAAPADAAGPVRVASLSPAATEILLGMDEADHLVAVSDHDADPRVLDLPRVGGYGDFDWERLAGLRPDVMVVQVGEANLPAGARERAAELGVEFVNVRIDRIDDIPATIEQLAAVVGADGDAAAGRFRDELDAAVDPPREGGRPRVLVALNSDLTFVAGRGNYLDDLIERAGGENAVPATFSAWPELDLEALRSLEVDAAVLILPAATDAQVAAAEANARAVGWEEVAVVTDADALVPGWRVIGLARTLREVAGRVRGNP